MSRLVLFDCDGVLVNTEEIGYQLLTDMLADHGVSMTREDFVRKIAGVTYAIFLENLKQEVKAQSGQGLPDDFRQKLSARLVEEHKRKMRAIDGVVPLLDNLQKHDVPFAVCSNSGAANLIAKLRQVGLFDYFVPRVFSRDHVENAKPAPDMYLMAARSLGDFDPQDCIVVEDSLTGATAGMAAGMKVIGFVGEPHRHHREADWLLESGVDHVARHHDEVWAYVAREAALSAVQKAPHLGSDLIHFVNSARENF